MVSKVLLEILACPACDDRPRVTPTPDGRFLACPTCHRQYPVENDIPIMLVDSAVMPGETPRAAPKPATP